MTSLRKQFGERLREIRKQRGMTQERLAESLDISIDFLSLMERDPRTVIRNARKDFKAIMRISVADLFIFPSS